MFSKDDEGCIPPDELQFVLQNLPQKVRSIKKWCDTNDLNTDKTTQIKFGEIKEMIETVDKNGDGKISYSEFRVMMGAVPLVMNWGL